MHRKQQFSRNRLLFSKKHKRRPDICLGHKTRETLENWQKHCYKRCIRFQFWFESNLSFVNPQNLDSISILQHKCVHIYIYIHIQRKRACLSVSLFPFWHAHGRARGMLTYHAQAHMMHLFCLRVAKDLFSTYRHHRCCFTILV